VNSTHPCHDAGNNTTARIALRSKPVEKVQHASHKQVLEVQKSMVHSGAASGVEEQSIGKWRGFRDYLLLAQKLIVSRHGRKQEWSRRGQEVQWRVALIRRTNRKSKNRWAVESGNRAWMAQCRRRRKGVFDVSYRTLDVILARQGCCRSKIPCRSCFFS
jgi:hypothetical protein